MRLNSVRTKLILWNFGVLALVLVALGAMLRATVEINLEWGINHGTLTFANQIARTCQNSGLLDPSRPLQNASPQANALFSLDSFHPYPPRILDISGRPLLLPSNVGGIEKAESLTA